MGDDGLSQVQPSFHLFVPSTQREAEFQQIHQQKLAWSWPGWGDFLNSEAPISFGHQSMIHPDPRERPSAAALARSQVLHPSMGKAEELQQQLNLERMKTATLER